MRLGSDFRWVGNSMEICINETDARGKGTDLETSMQEALMSEKRGLMKRVIREFEGFFDSKLRESEDRFLQMKAEAEVRKDEQLKMKSKEVYETVEREYSQILEQKDNSILQLKKRVTKLAASLEKEREKQEKVIKQAIEKVRKQRSEDLRSFMEKKNELAEQMGEKTDEELKKYKQRVEMEIEFKARQAGETQQEKYDQELSVIQKDRDEFKKSTEEKMMKLVEKKSASMKSKYMTQVQKVYDEIKQKFKKIQR